jgi:[ribosomal protein S18]-alanine N-acetyltransferase
MKIRPMLAVDLDQVAAIDALSMPSPWSQELFEAELKRDMARYFTAEDEQGRVAGYLGYWEAPGEAHLITLAVHPGQRRRGVARALLTHSFGYAAQKGASLATLEVRAGNEIAQKLYEGFGFRLVAVRKKYYSDNLEDAHVMLMELPPG